MSTLHLVFGESGIVASEDCLAHWESFKLFKNDFTFLTHPGTGLAGASESEPRVGLAGSSSIGVFSGFIFLGAPIKRASHKSFP